MDLLQRGAPRLQVCLSVHVYEAATDSWRDYQFRLVYVLGRLEAFGALLSIVGAETEQMGSGSCTCSWTICATASPCQQTWVWLRELEGWSGTILPLPTGEHLPLVNGLDARTRRTLTIAHELGHLMLGYKPLALGSAVRRWDNHATRQVQPDQGRAGRLEQEATTYAQALLLPYALLPQLLAHGAPVPAIVAVLRLLSPCGASRDALIGRLRHLRLL